MGKILAKSWNLFEKAFLSVFFVGFIPLAPGTAGTLVGFLFLLLVGKRLEDMPFNLGLGFLLAFIVFLLFSASFIIRRKGAQDTVDEQWIVIDEFIGMMIAGFLFLFWPAFGWKWLFAAFLFFRFFDILKPLGIKKIDKWHNFFAVVLDDVVAGFYALFAILIMFFLFN